MRLFIALSKSGALIFDLSDSRGSISTSNARSGIHTFMCHTPCTFIVGTVNTDPLCRLLIRGLCPRLGDERIMASLLLLSSSECDKQLCSNTMLVGGAVGAFRPRMGQRALRIQGC